MNRSQFSSVTRSLLVSRLARYLAITVYGTVLAVCLATIVYRYNHTVQVHFTEKQQDVGELFRAAVDDRRFPVIPELIEIGEHLVRIGLAEGGVYVDAIGQDQGRFGQLPDLTWRDAVLTQVSERTSHDRQHLDIYLRPDETEIQYGVILRVDARPVWRAVWSDMRHELAISLVIGLLCAVAISAAVMLMVLRPLRKMTASALAAANDPGMAHRMLTGIRQNDELGSLSGAVDELLLIVSNLFNEELANAIGVINGLPEATLIYRAEGELEHANEAALALFGFDDREDFAAIEGHFLRLDETPLSVRDAVSEGLNLTEAEVSIGGQWISAHVGGGAVRRLDGSVKRYFITISDLSPIAAQMEKLSEDKEKSDRAYKDQLLRAEELRQMLEACRILMELSGDGKRPAYRTRSIMPDRAVAKWQEQAVASGQMAPDNVRHGFLPPLTSDDLSVERIFKSALNIVRGRSNRTMPKIAITAKPASDKLCIFTIAEIEAFTVRPRTRTSEREMDTSLYLAILAKLLSRLSGKVTSAGGHANENLVSFVVPIDRGAMAIIRGTGKRPKSDTGLAEAGDNENLDLSAASSEVS